ncbi:MAG: hypothetical protein JO001_29430 [Alphaproteobacteria bacterium]|nr:hypothetical protein [Alphaproteobacteria bacterium]
MLDFQTTLLVLTAAINGGLFAFVYLGNPRSPVNRSFAFFVLSLSVWALLHVGFRLVTSDTIANELLKASYVCALLIAASFYYFSLVFPDGNRPRRVYFGTLVAVTGLFSIVLLSPGFLTGSIVHDSYGRAAILKVRDYLAFAAVFCALFLGGQIRLWLKYYKARGVARTQLLALAMSVTVIGLVGIFFDLILPSPFFENFQFIWTGPVLTSAFAIITTYAIFRYHLFNLKAAIVEILVFTWWLSILVRTLSASASLDVVLDQVLVVFSVPIGTLVLRSLQTKHNGRERESD